MNHHILGFLLIINPIFSMKQDIKEYKFKSPFKKVKLMNSYCLPTGDIFKPYFNNSTNTLEWYSNNASKYRYAVNNPVVTDTERPYKNLQFLKVSNVNNTWYTVAIGEHKYANDIVYLISDRSDQIQTIAKKNHLELYEGITAQKVGLMRVIGDTIINGSVIKENQDLLLLKTIIKRPDTHELASVCCVYNGEDENLEVIELNE